MEEFPPFEPVVFLLEPNQLNAMSWVILGGMIGGLLLKPLSFLQERLLVYRGLRWYQTAALGAAAAGVTSFVFGNSELDRIPHLFFLAVLSGLAFPGLLVSAIDRVTKWTREAELMNELANQSANPKRRPAVAREASKLLAASRGVGDQKLRGQIDQSATKILENMAKQSDGSPPDMQQMIEGLEMLGKAADEGGFPVTRFQVLDKLEDIQDSAPGLTDSNRESISSILKQLSREP